MTLPKLAIGSRLVIATVLAALVLAGCSSGAGPSKVASLEVTPGALLFMRSGETATLSATAFDASGAPVDATITWSSSDPSVVAVEPDGTIRIQADLGSASITATADGVDSFPASIVVAQPVAGAVLIADEQVVARPVPVEGTSDPIRQRVELTGIGAVAPGDVIIGAETARIGGQVESVTPTADGLEVVYAPLPPRDLFDKLSLDYDIDLSAAPVVPVEGSVVGAEAMSGVVSAAAPEPKEVCEGDVSFATISGMSTTFDNDLHYHLHLQDGVADLEPTTLYVDGTITQKVSGGVSVKAGFTGTYTCKAVLFRIPIPISGVAALVARPVVPIGVAFSASGSVTSAAASVNLEASTGLDLKAGFTYDETTGLTMFHDFAPKNEAPKLTLDLVTPSTFRVGASLFGGLMSGVDVDVVGLDDISLVQAQLGPQQSFDLATAGAQAASDAYASSYDLSIVASIGLGADLGKLMGWVGITVPVQVAQLQSTYPISKSPSGAFTASTTSVAPGDSLHLHVALDPEHLTYLTHYNVSKVEIYRSHGSEDPSLWRTIELSASNQSDFDTVWDTTGEAGGAYRFQAFVVDDLLAKVVEVPLEVAADSTLTINVADVCVEPGTMGPSAMDPTAIGPLAACTGGTTWDYSQPDDDNGIAWEVHTTGSDLTWEQDADNPLWFNLTGATVSWTDVADYIAGCSIASSGSDMHITNTDPEAGAYVSGLIMVGSDSTYYGSAYAYVPDAADDGCFGGTKDENVPLFVTGDVVPSLSSDGQGGSLLTGSASLASAVDGTGTTTWDFHFADLPAE